MAGPQVPARPARGLFSRLSERWRARPRFEEQPRGSARSGQTVQEARRQTRTGARVAVHCEAWSDAELEALYRRADRDVSLYRGEGWCYPLFEAACRGTPVIATLIPAPSNT